MRAPPLKVTVAALFLSGPSIASPSVAIGQQTCGDGEEAVRGVLSDAGSGVVLPGVGVTGSWRDAAGGEAVETATTDIVGGFSLCVPQDAIGLRISAAVGAVADTIEVSWPTLDPIALQLAFSASEDASLAGATYAAQSGTGASIRGRVEDSGAGRPVAGARVDLDSERGVALTDDNGAFALPSVSPGLHMLKVEHLGYRPLVERIEARVGQITTLDIGLAPEALQVEPLVVSVFRDARLDRTGFYDRKARGEALGIGRYITREDIEAWPSHRTSDLVSRVPLMDMVRVCEATCFLVPRVVGSTPKFSSTGGVSPCPAEVYVDGARVRLWRYTASNALEVFAGIDELVMPSSIAGVEVYRRASELPAEFGGATDGCGAVVIWTR